MSAPDSGAPPDPLYLRPAVPATQPCRCVDCADQYGDQALDHDEVVIAKLGRELAKADRELTDLRTELRRRSLRFSAELNAGIEMEREACAKIADDLGSGMLEGGSERYELIEKSASARAATIAKRIRARGDF